MDINLKHKLHGDHGSLDWEWIETRKNEYYFSQITDNAEVAVRKIFEK